MTFLKNFIQDEEGQDLVEYALLLGFVAVAGIAILTAFNTSLTGLFSTADTKLTGATFK